MPLFLKHLALLDGLKYLGIQSISVIILIFSKIDEMREKILTVLPPSCPAFTPASVLLFEQGAKLLLYESFKFPDAQEGVLLSSLMLCCSGCCGGPNSAEKSKHRVCLLGRTKTRCGRD